MRNTHHHQRRNQLTMHRKASDNRSTILVAGHDTRRHAHALTEAVGRERKKPELTRLDRRRNISFQIQKKQPSPAAGGRCRADLRPFHYASKQIWLRPPTLYGCLAHHSLNSHRTTHEMSTSKGEKIQQFLRAIFTERKRKRVDK